MKGRRGLIDRRFEILLLSLALAFAIGGLPETAAAERLVMELPSHPVRIHYRTDDERVARRVGEICEDRLDELSSEIGLLMYPMIEVEVAADIGPYRRRLGKELPDWGVAFALMREGRMVVDVGKATRAWNSLETVIPHELSHLLVARRVGGTPMTIWFLEGLAQWQADEWSLVDSWQLMNAVWSKQAPKLWHLHNRYPESEEAARNAYRVSYSAFTYLFGEEFDRLPLFLDEVARRGDFETAFNSYFGEHPTTFYVRFHKHLDGKYHSRLLVFQTGPLFSILAAAFFLVAIRFYLRKRRRLKEMAEEPGGGNWPGDGHAGG
jgi:hypothetical protein